MEKYNSAKIVRKYTVVTSVSVVLLAILTVVLSIRFMKFFLIFYGAYFLFSYTLKTVLYNKYINSALTEELNAEKYDELIKTGKLYTLHNLESISSYYHNGEYQKSLNLSLKLLMDTKFKKYKYYYLINIARCYFVTNNSDGIRESCILFEEFLKNEKHPEKIRNRYPVFKLYNYYLNGDFEACNQYLNNQISNPKFYKRKIDIISFDFSFAIIAYKNGDFENAMLKFKKIINTAPLLNYSTLSQKYINAIEQKDESLINERLTVDRDFEVPNYNIIAKKYKRLSALRIIIAICLSITLAAQIMLLFLPKTLVHFKGLDYYSTKADIIELYGKPDETKPCIFPDDKYYDSYNKTFLGVTGKLNVEYLDDNDSVWTVSFIIDSNDFDNKDEYNKAVEKTYKYFDKNLPKDIKKDNSNDEVISVSWSYERYGYTYMIYNTKIIHDDSNNITDGMVFQFNTHKTNN